MYDIAINQLTYISIIVILSVCASVFFYANPARKDEQYNKSLSYFSAFFALSALGFTSFAFSINQFKVVAIFCTNFLLVSAFFCLLHGFKQRLKQEHTLVFKTFSYWATSLSVALLNSALHLAFPEEHFARTILLLSTIIYLTLLATQHVSLKSEKQSYGEKTAQYTLYISVACLILLLAILLVTRNSLLYLSLLTVAYSAVLVLLMGSIQTMFLSDFANKFKKESNTDFLTGLYNRRYFMRTAQEFIDLSKRSNSPSCAIMLDIDDFKFINDIFGHDIGDQVLQNVAEILNSTIRETDICARIGGEEFCIFLSNTDLAGACLLAERIREKATALITPSSICDVKVSLSFGVSAVSDNNSLLDTIKHADRALYFAKENGKNQVCNYARVQHLQRPQDERYSNIQNEG